MLQTIVDALKAGAHAPSTGAFAGRADNPDEVGYINAHGPGTNGQRQDRCAAVRNVLWPCGQADDRSTKSMHGHLIGGHRRGRAFCLHQWRLRDGVIARPSGLRRTRPRTGALDVGANISTGCAVLTVALSNAFGPLAA